MCLTASSQIYVLLAELEVRREFLTHFFLSRVFPGKLRHAGKGSFITNPFQCPSYRVPHSATIALQALYRRDIT